MNEYIIKKLETFIILLPKSFFMKRTLCFATGTIWRWSEGKNRAELINYAKKLGFPGIELTLGKKEELYNTKISASQVKWLRNLDYVSIHAPFRLLREADNQEEVIKQLDCIEKIYKQIRAKMIIIHPLDLPPKEVLDKYNMNFSTENLPKKRQVTIRKLHAIFKRYPKLGLCLDVAHAYFWSMFETEKLIKAFKNRITQIHLSGTYRRKDHLPLQQVSPMFIKSIQPIKELEVPVIIEEDVKIKNIKLVKKEIRYIKSLIL